MEAIIFDVDGTLWDSTTVVAGAWNKVIKEHTGMEKNLTGDDLKQLFGKPLEEIFGIILPELTKVQRDNLSVHMYAEENKQVARASGMLYESVKETIPYLAGKYRLYIVSNCQGGYIEAFLKNSGLEEYFEDFTCPDYTGHTKAYNIRSIIDRYHLTDAVYVGDTDGDEKACQEAGIPIIYAAYGFGRVDSPLMVIENFSDLEHAIELT